MTHTGDQEIGAVSGRVGMYDFKGLCCYRVLLF